MLFPVLIVSLVFAFLSVRLFRTAFQAGGAEGWLGGFFLCVGISMPLRTFVGQHYATATDSEVQITLASHFLMTAGLLMYTLFVDRVFRQDFGWARLITAFLILIQILAPLALIFFGAHRDERHPVLFVVGIIRALPFMWGFCEAYLFYGQMRKRAALGLSDPVVTNRFALFAVWNGMLFALPVCLVAVRVWARVATEDGAMLGGGATANLILGVTRVMLLVMAGSAVFALWLSFFPPNRWLERIRNQAEFGTS